MQGRLIELFEGHFKEAVEDTQPLAAHASPRARTRLTSKNRSVIGVKNDNVPENRAFFYLSDHFRKYNLPVPEIFCVHPSGDCYLEEDLGHTTLYDLLQTARSQEDPFPADIEALYRKAIEFLPCFQIVAGKSVDYSKSHKQNHFGIEFMLADMRYFRDQFLRETGHFFDEFALNRDFQKLAEYLAAVPSEYFMYRDFQSRNIMVKNGNLYFIDYQGGCRGALQYDLVSLLYQAQAKIPNEVRERLKSFYLDALSKYIKIDREEFLEFLNAFILLRTLQVLGTYGLRGLKQGKQYFIDSIDLALDNLRWLYKTKGLPVKMPELERIIRSISASKQEGGANMKDDEKLTLALYSFSYKQATAVPFNPHGGGFVFDCRCLPNPGREEAYKTKSGLDKEVIDYLENRIEVQEFFTRIAAIIEQAVQAYMNRKFSSLTVAFGCTGGQHRSVYFAERLAKYLSERYDIMVKTEHLNKDYWVKTLKDKVSWSMRAMIFAAGLGTRLGEITRTTPKCLVEAGGKPILAYVIERLKAAGVDRIVVNLFHLGEQIEEYIQRNNSFGIDIQFSKETELLGTGGGLLNAEWFFKDSEDFIVYNGDIYSEIDLSKVVAAHRVERPLATLVMMRRQTSRVLVFNKKGELRGWANRKTGEVDSLPAAPDDEDLAFSGIQVISKEIFNFMRQEPKNFSTIKAYMNGIKEGKRILSFLAETEYWMDMGKPETLEQLRKRLAAG